MTMLEMNPLGWIVVGFLAGAISGRLVGAKTARGCLPNIVVGIIGGLVGGWLADARGYHRPMTDSPTDAPAATAAPDDAATANRPFSPGLMGVVAGETSLSLVDGERGRLLYRGYRIGDLVAHGTYPAVANLLWTGEWDPSHRLATAPVPPAVMTILRALPASTKPMDAH